ncbi:GNAT family N-acetyltransferase [Flavobacterium sp. CYK-55]|uniref:GNAT family N-acetyltransferase n=1 Tax=Flavobacterium sp. CYK-55 TaxID=2835529 RepID=UPI001BCDD98A|nr:GNAT family N-acetyltransferase [Flavobacterium sp. CYK-55]MBS7787673.1 GNAT family N-acetyltransferase [Flavobacterium sp. CYK-55]
MLIQLIETKPTDSEIKPLIENLSTELGKRFGDTGKNSFQEWDEENPKSVFVKAIFENEAVGCGAIRPISNEIAELKRMYSKYNRKGIGKSVLGYLENKAKELDYKEIWLETRKLNLEACDFYLKNDYKQIPNFGKYIGNEKAICFGKKLDK